MRGTSSVLRGMKDIGSVCGGFSGSLIEMGMEAVRVSVGGYL